MAKQGHVRLTLSGDIGPVATPYEHFAFGVSLDTDGRAVANGQVDFEGWDSAQWDDIVTDSSNFFSDASVGISQTCRLRQIKLAFIGDDGLYVKDPLVRDVDVAGGGPVLTYPPQVALAVSTQITVGGRTRKAGRFYLPGPTSAIDATTGVISQADADAKALACHWWLTNLNNEPGLDTLGVRAIVATTKYGNQPIDKVFVGRALDTIRSRRRSLKEGYGVGSAVDPQA